MPSVGGFAWVAEEAAEVLAGHSSQTTIGHFRDLGFPQFPHCSHLREIRWRNCRGNRVAGTEGYRDPSIDCVPRLPAPRVL